jgi:hypothetical protein
VTQPDFLALLHSIRCVLDSLNAEVRTGRHEPAALAWAASLAHGALASLHGATELLERRGEAKTA